MSLSQTKIKFNVRKKRIIAKTAELIKESRNIAIVSKDNCICRKSDSVCDSDEENNAERLPSTSARRGKRSYKSADNTLDCSPPKRNRLKSRKEQSSTLKSASSSTPVSPLSKLSVSSPDSIENEINGIRAHLKPKQLFADFSNSQKSSTFRAARIALGSSILTGREEDGREEKYSPLIGREEQFHLLLSSLHACIDDNTAFSAYVSGPPGTGKTASLGNIMQDPKVKSGFQCIFLNCTSMRTASSVYSHIAKSLNTKLSAKGEKGWQIKAEELVTRSRKRILLVLDELDQLLMGGGKSASQQIVYTIFGWPYLPSSKISVIGVANALDLTSRSLPRLHSCNPPMLIHFPPYTREQIHKILLHRLEKAGVGEVFSVSALQMLASKVASVSGDVRRALDVGRRVVQLVGDKDSQNKKELPSLNFGIPQQPTESKTNSENPSKTHSVVELQEVLSVLNGVYSTSQSLVSTQSKGESSGNDLPIQQKYFLCVLILIVKKGPKGKPITIGRLHEVYVRVCKRRNLTPVDQSEFHNLCTLVETRGIIRIISSKEARLSKVSLQWDEEEVAGALMDKHLLASILADVSCLSR